MTLTVAGVDTVPSGVGLAIYRIVQEALTNTVRHAPGARCAVTVRGADDAVRITVTDDGRGTQATAGEPGYGLIGIRERVGLLGGDLAAGHRPEGGFELRAVIPMRQSETAND